MLASIDGRFGVDDDVGVLAKKCHSFIPLAFVATTTVVPDFTTYLFLPQCTFYCFFVL
jgi:hypothetical protein